MTYVELCHQTSKKHKLDEAQVRKVLDAAIGTINEALKEGDEVKLMKLGTFYTREYQARQGSLEFGGVGEGGKRRRLRFKPFDSTNHHITVGFKK